MPVDPWLAAAYAYAKRGWPVFPLGRRTKRPVANCPACPTTKTAGKGHDPARCPCLCCHGFYAATTDPDRITAMRARHPSGLLAIATGAVSGLVVADIDPRNGGTIHPDLMPQTACVATGSGGRHLLYTYPGVPVPSRGLPGFQGIDIKADGGYIAAAPSVHPGTGRPYRWLRFGPVEEMPRALLDLATADPAPTGPPPTRAASTRPPSTSAAGGISHPDRLLVVLLDRVATAPEGRRRTTLYGVARGVARMIGAHTIDPGEAWALLYNAGRAAGQTDRDTRAAITGGFHAEGVTA